MGRRTRGARQRQTTTPMGTMHDRNTSEDDTSGRSSTEQLHPNTWDRCIQGRTAKYGTHASARHCAWGRLAAVLQLLVLSRPCCLLSGWLRGATVQTRSAQRLVEEAKRSTTRLHLNCIFVHRGLPGREGKYSSMTHAALNRHNTELDGLT